MGKRDLSNARFVTLAALLVAVMAVVSACGPAPVAAAQTVEDGVSEHVITVTGTGQALGRPDVAYIELGVDVANSDVGEAMTEANETMTEVRDAIIELGIPEEDIRTTQFNVWVEEIRDPQTGSPRGERLFHVNNLMRIKVSDTERVAEVIETGTGAGANTINNLFFAIEEPGALEEQARTDAVADARSRAEQLAAAAGVELGALVNLTESTGGSGPLIERAAAFDQGLGGGAPPISEGQLAVSVTVSASFLIEQ